MSDDTASEIVQQFNAVGEQILAELRGLREELKVRPTRTEMTVRRRLMVVVLLIFGWVSLMANDHHVTQCEPGARAADAVEYLAITPAPQFSVQRMRSMLNDPIPATCDVLYPTETHEYGESWPTSGNLFGLGIYFMLLIGLYLWYRWPTFKDPGQF